MTHDCGDPEHEHKTALAAAKCGARRFDQGVLLGGLTPVQKKRAWHRPARRVQAGPFEVAVYGENEAAPYG